MKLFVITAVTILLAPAACAQHQTFSVNPQASDVQMTLKTNHDVVHGTFHVASGAIEFDRAAAKMAGTVVVSAGSGKTGNDMRDRKMNKEILKTDEFTSVSFAPKSYTGALAAAGDSTLQVSGVFTLLGTPHELTIPMQVHLEGSKATATAHFKIPYVQWGVKSPNFLIWKAEEEVALDLNLVGALGN